MSLSENVKNFNKKLSEIEVFIKQLYDIKTTLNLNIKNCVFDEGNSGKIEIRHPDMPTLEIYEYDLDNFEKIKEKMQSHLAQEKRKKRMYDLNFQINYWLHQTSPEFIAEKQKNIEEWKTELQSLEQT